MKLLNIGVNHPWDVSISEFAKRYDVVELTPEYSGKYKFPVQSEEYDHFFLDTKTLEALTPA